MYHCLPKHRGLSSISVLTSCFPPTLAVELLVHIIKYIENILNISVNEDTAKHMNTQTVPTVKGNIACVYSHIGFTPPVSCVWL